MLPRPECLWGRTRPFDVFPGVHQPERGSYSHQYVVPMAGSHALRSTKRSVLFISAERLLLIFSKDNFVPTYPLTPAMGSYVWFVSDCNI